MARPSLTLDTTRRPLLRPVGEQLWKDGSTPKEPLREQGSLSCVSSLPSSVHEKEVRFFSLNTV